MIGFKTFAVICALALTANVDVSGNSLDEDNPDLDFVESDENLDDFTGDQSSTEEDILSILTNIYDSVSGNSLVVDDDISSGNLDISPYAAYQGSYGSISSDLYNYFSGFLSKLNPEDHYVCSRYFQGNSNNNYFFAWGDSLEYVNGVFSGSDVNVVTIYGSSSGTFYRYELQSSFSFSPANNYVYTDLSFKYPALSRPGDVSLRQICYVLAFFILFYTFTKFVVFPRRLGRRRL